MRLLGLFYLGWAMLFTIVLVIVGVILILRKSRSEENYEENIVNDGDEHPKRLYRNKRSGIICGVCSGVADYFNWDPSLVRIGFLVLLVCTRISILTYFIVAIIVPERR